MLPFTWHPTSSLRSTANPPSSASLRPVSLPTGPGYLIDNRGIGEPHGHGDYDNLLVGISLSSQSPVDGGQLATLASSPGDQTHIRGQVHDRSTFGAVRSPSSSFARPPSQVGRLLPISPATVLDAAGVDEEDDTAFFELLMKRRETRLDIELDVIQPIQATQKQLQLDKPPDNEPHINDPLDLYFTAADYVAGAANDELWTARGDTCDNARSLAINFLESLMLNFCIQLHSCPHFSGCSGCGSLKSSIGSKDQREECFGLTMSMKDRKTGALREHCFPHEPRRAPKRPVLLHMSSQGTEQGLISARVLLVASVLYDAILSDICVTLRDVYYRDVALFNHQRVVDKIVDDLVATAGLRRDDFRVFATGKGLMASKAVKIKLTTGEELSLSSTTPTLIPRGEAIQSLEAPDGIEWILVVEKDAVLQTLCSSRLLDDLRLGPGILVTGKGFPDLSTLQLLRRMADQFPCARICALVDADPHGIGIMAVYAYSSKANRYSEDHSGLALCSRIEYLGFKPTEWSSVARYDELVEMSARDVQLAKNLCVDLADVNPEWRRELVQMLHLNRKAELQVLSGPPSCDGWAVAGRRCLSLPGSPNRLIEYIVSKLSQSKCCLHQKVSEPARTDTLGPSRQTA